MAARLKNAIALVAALNLTACADDPTGDNAALAVGGAIGGIAADYLNASDPVIGGAIVIGAGLAQALNRTTTGGCFSAGTTTPEDDGYHVFYNEQMGIIQCPPNRMGNPVITELQKDPRWIEIRRTGNRGRKSQGSFVFGFTDLQEPYELPLEVTNGERITLLPEGHEVDLSHVLPLEQKLTLLEKMYPGFSAAPYLKLAKHTGGLPRLTTPSNTLRLQ